MGIIIGWNSFNLESFKLDEQNVPKVEGGDADDHIYLVEVRQKYFHIFFIPFFSLGKLWILHHKGQVYELPENLKRQVQANYNIKTPFYTYTLFWLALLAGIIFFANEKYEAYDLNQYRKKEYNAVLANIDQKLKTLQPDDYLVLEKKYRSSYFLKINRINGNTITASKYFRENPTITIYDAMKEQSYSAKDTVSFTLDKIKKAIYRNFENEDSMYDFGIDFFNNDTIYRLIDIQNLHEGNLSLDNSYLFYIGYGDSCTTGCINLHFVNTGAPMTLVTIKNLTGTIQWRAELPLSIPHSKYENFNNTNTEIDGTHYYRSAPFKTIFVFRNELNKLQTYIIENKNGNNIEIERVYK
jgi:hypothetical protein